MDLDERELWGAPGGGEDDVVAYIGSMLVEGDEADFVRVVLDDIDGVLNITCGAGGGLIASEELVCAERVDEVVEEGVRGVVNEGEKVTFLIEPTQLDDLVWRRVVK